MSGWFDIASQARWNKLSEEWVAVKGSLLMTNEVGESKSDCYREGKVLLQRKHWHQLIKRNRFRPFTKKKKKSLLCNSPSLPLPSPYPLPQNGSWITEQKMKPKKVTIPQNDSTTRFKSKEPELLWQPVNCMAQVSLFTLYQDRRPPFIIVLPQNVTKHPHHKVCVAVFTRWIL